MSSEAQGIHRKVYTILDFTDEEGCVYSEIEFIVEVVDSDDIRETARLAGTLQQMGISR
jgi:hypothetical protein